MKFKVHKIKRIVLISGYRAMSISVMEIKKNIHNLLGYFSGVLRRLN